LLLLLVLCSSVPAVLIQAMFLVIAARTYVTFTVSGFVLKPTLAIVLHLGCLLRRQVTGSAALMPLVYLLVEMHAFSNFEPSLSCWSISQARIVGKHRMLI
jgi:hypothetical protein